MTRRDYRSFPQTIGAGRAWLKRYPDGDHHPAEGVSWHHAQEYLKWLGRETGCTYRPPSEVAWEYAALARRTVLALAELFRSDDGFVSVFLWRSGDTLLPD